MTEVALTDVSKHYATPGGVVRALDGVTLEVASGSSLAITGPSGCGKSTLLSLIAGMERPTSGRVVVAGVDVARLRPDERAGLRARCFGLVLQQDNLLPFLTAVENVALQLALRESAGGFEHCRAMLAKLGLADLADRLPDQMSGGQRQRVAIARALVGGPSVILADEPTGSLDEESSAAVADLLISAHKRSGATLIVVTHDPDVASRLEETATLQEGRLHSPIDSLSQECLGAS